MFLNEETAGFSGAHLAHMGDEAGDVADAKGVATSNVWWDDDVPDTGNGRGYEAWERWSRLVLNASLRSHC